MNEQERKADNDRRLARLTSARVDLKALRLAADKARREVRYSMPVASLLAVVDAAREAERWGDASLARSVPQLRLALEPFTPAEVDARAEDAELVRGLLAHTEPIDGRVFNERMQAEDRRRRLADLGIELRGWESVDEGERVQDDVDVECNAFLDEPQAAPADGVDTAVSDAVSSGAGGRQNSLTGRRDSPQGSTSEPAPSSVDRVQVRREVLEERVDTEAAENARLWDQADEVAALKDRVEQAERERDEARDHLHSEGRLHRATEQQLADVEACLARVPALVGALRPFAELPPTDTMVAAYTLPSSCVRAARAALAEWEQA